MKSNFLRIFAIAAILSLLLPSSSVQAWQSIRPGEAPAQEAMSEVDPMLPEGLTNSEWQSIRNQITTNLSQQAYLKASNTGAGDFLAVLLLFPMTRSLLALHMKPVLPRVSVGKRMTTML